MSCKTHNLEISNFFWKFYFLGIVHENHCFRMANRNNFIVTMVRNLGKHDAKFLNEKILVEKDFSEGYPDRLSRLRVV